MGMKALGAYFEELRGSQSREALATAMGVSVMSILRIEEKGQEPKAEMLNNLVRTLRARWEDVEELLSNKRATADEGRRLARQRIEERAKEIADRVPDEEVAEALRIVRSLRESPQALRELRELLSSDDAGLSGARRR
jgi:transcriptional regulator with XRE-family HTH domain